MSDPGPDHPFGPSPIREPGEEPRRRLRPAPMSALFEIGFRILRRHWAVLLGVSFLVGLPSALLGAASAVPFGEAMLRVLPDEGATGPIVIGDAQARALGDGLLIAAVGAIIAGVLAAVAAVGFAWVVSRDYHGRRVTFGDTLARAVRRAVTALLATLLAGLATIGLGAAGTMGVIATLTILAPAGPAQGGIGVFLAIVVGVAAALAIVVLSVRWALALPVIAIEEVGPVAALRRSWHLTGEATWRTFGVLLLVGLLTTILEALVTQLLEIVVVDLLLDPMGFGLLGATVVSTIVTLLFAPVSVVVMTVYLFDRKVRRDDWDLPAA